MLLPYIDQAPLYNQANFNLGIIGNGATESTQTNVTTQRIPAFLCPSDGTPPGSWYSKPWAGNSYALSVGTTIEWANRSNIVGMFTLDSGKAFRDVHDGLSNTIMMAEIAIGTGSKNMHGSWERGIAWTGGPNQNPSVQDVLTYSQAAKTAWDGGTNQHHHGGRLWALGQPQQTLMNTIAPPNWRFPSASVCSGCGWFDANGMFPSRSRHVGGSQHLMGDGSVHFVSENIDHALYMGLGTIAGNETVTFP